jgi:DNA invertase Pin-like site-specific DNA recombinase
MPTGTFVSYLRVSTARQGHSGLGLEAQRKSVSDYLNGGGGRLIAEFVEVESGLNSSRPKLLEALAACRIHGATLVVAKLDRLSRNAAFLINLQNSGVQFVAADNPHVNQMVVGILAVVAEEEAKIISRRTKDALAAAKARGAKLGSPRPISRMAQLNGARNSLRSRRQASAQWFSDVRPIVTQCYRESGSFRGAARLLNDKGIPARRKGLWSAAQVIAALSGSGKSAGQGEGTKSHPIDRCGNDSDEGGAGFP